MLDPVADSQELARLTCTTLGLTLQRMLLAPQLQLHATRRPVGVGQADKSRDGLTRRSPLRLTLQASRLSGFARALPGSSLILNGPLYF